MSGNPNRRLQSPQRPLIHPSAELGRHPCTLHLDECLGCRFPPRHLECFLCIRSFIYLTNIQN